MPSLTVETNSKNIFNYEWPYHIQCIGKSVSPNPYVTNAQKSYFYFTSHDLNYQVIEDVRDRGEICNISIEKVEYFDVPSGYNYFKFTNENLKNSAELEALIDNMHTGYGKNGFYIFPQIQMYDGKCFGGVMSSYDFESCSEIDLQMLLNEKMYKEPTRSKDEKSR